MKQRVNTVANPENLEPYRWKPGQSGNPNGRPRKITDVIKELLGDELKCELSPSQVKEFIMRCMEMNPDELIQISESRTAPVFLVATAKALIKDMESGRTQTLENVFDRVMGKPKQDIGLTGKDGEPFSLVAIIKGANEPE